jgi:hypothetical protein
MTKNAIARTLAIALLTFAAALAGTASRVSAAEVSGVLAADEGGIAGRQLHYENRATRDIYMAVTDRDGSFSADLPPGIYDLRGQRGTIFMPAIIVTDAAVKLGTVSKPTGFNPTRLFQYQGIAPVLVYTPAPSTAYLGGAIEGISTVLPVAPVTGEFSQKGGAGGTPIMPGAGNPMPPPMAPAAPPSNSRLTPVP